MKGVMADEQTTISIPTSDWPSRQDTERDFVLVRRNDLYFFAPCGGVREVAIMGNVLPHGFKDKSLLLNVRFLGGDKELVGPQLGLSFSGVVGCFSYVRPRPDGGFSVTFPIPAGCSRMLWRLYPWSSDAVYVSPDVHVELRSDIRDATPVNGRRAQVEGPS